jgi:TorA maturation chaperone TorD
MLGIESRPSGVEERGALSAVERTRAGDVKADEVDLLRAQEYRLLAALLRGAPSADLLSDLSKLRGDETPLGSAHTALGSAASEADPVAVDREFFSLFVGVGRGELLPYGSFYLTGFLNERPLAAVRHDMAKLGLERAEGLFDPEDHIATLCDVMAALATGDVPANAVSEADFFRWHLAPWVDQFFADLKTAPSAFFYRHVAEVGSVFMAVEREAFAMDAA